MNRAALSKILENHRLGSLSLEEALAQLKDYPSAELGFAVIDNNREMRTGHPEVVYCAGKTAAQLRAILEHMLKGPTAILATRADQAQWAEVRTLSDRLVYDPLSRTIARRSDNPPSRMGYVAVVAAGTSDLPVAEEAAITAEVFGNRVERIYDVGVAGLHRLLHRLDTIRGANAVIAVAGMEGALPSVLGGLIDKPLIAVPTSVGYGASLGGIAALLAMLNSCAPGVTVVNIDNGFGAGYAASTVNRLSAAQ